MPWDDVGHSLDLGDGPRQRLWVGDPAAAIGSIDVGRGLPGKQVAEMGGAELWKKLRSYRRSCGRRRNNRGRSGLDPRRS